MICFFAIFLLFVCLHILSVRCGVLYATRKFNTELNKHCNKSYISCDETCFCWDVSNLIDDISQKWCLKSFEFGDEEQTNDNQ